MGLVIVVGCSGGLLGGSGPLALRGHGVNPTKSETKWSSNLGPKLAGHFRAVAVADFNQDGNLDLVGGSYEPGAIFLWVGDGLGNWKRHQRFPIKADIRSIATGDIDNDGWIDMLSSSYGDTLGIQVWRNNQGQFEPKYPVSQRDMYEGIRLVDINDDGKLDLLAANGTEVEKGGIQVWLGDGKCGFLVETGPTRTGMYRDVAVGDFNKDGKLDIVGAGWNADKGSVRLWQGSGDGRWSNNSAVIEGSFLGIDTADINNDGNLDILVAANFDGVRIYFGDGKGNFPENHVFTKKGSFRMTRAVDVDQNGLLDVVATSNDNHGILIWYQERPQDWKAKAEGLPAEGFYFDFITADFNKDGRVDIASATHGEGIRAWFQEVEGATLRTPPGKPGTIKETVLTKKLVKEEKIVLPELATSVFFDSGSASLRPESMVVLSKILELLKNFEDVAIKLEGHADPQNISPALFKNNQILSEARAEAVRDFFVESGIDAKRIKIAAFGATKDDYPNGSSDSYQKRRRVDITTSEHVVSFVEEKETSEKQVTKEHPKSEEAPKTETSPENKEELPGKADPQSASKQESEYPFLESGDVVPAADYKAFKMINNIPEYRLGPGDKLEVTLWEGLIEKVHKVEVSPRGTLSFSYIKDFPIEGLSPTEAEAEFVKLLSDFIKEPKAKVVVVLKNAHQISIFGAVRSLTRQPTGPGTYKVLGKEKLTEFLSRVGGHETNSDLTRVQLNRNKKTYYLNIYDALFKGDFRQDVVIDAGDLIFIPSKREVKNRVFVMGEVRKPGMFNYEGKLSLMEAIIYAGGPTFYGDTQDVVVMRGDVSKPEAIKVNFNDIVEKGDFRKNIKLQNGDLIFLAKNTIGNINEFVMKISPFLSLAKLPMDVYTSTTIPFWEGFPLQRHGPSAPETLISTPSSPPGSGTWGVGGATK